MLGASSAMQREEPSAFGTQIEGTCLQSQSLISGNIATSRPWLFGRQWAAFACEELYLITVIVRYRMSANSDLEVDRALDNLVNSGKLFNPSSRRDSMPVMGGQRPYADYGNIHYSTCMKCNILTHAQTNAWADPHPVTTL